MEEAAADVYEPWEKLDELFGIVTIVWDFSVDPLGSCYRFGIHLSGVKSEHPEDPFKKRPNVSSWLAWASKKKEGDAIWRLNVVSKR